MSKSFLILGGYGNTGFLIARYLLQETDSKVIVAGRNLENAGLVAEELNRLCWGFRAEARRADIADPQSLREAFDGIDMVILAAGSTKDTGKVARAALDAGIDYFDIQLSTSLKIDTLNALRTEIEQAGRCFITDGGFHPGLPALLVRYVAPYFDQLETANIGSINQNDVVENPITASNALDFLSELQYSRLEAYTRGQWRQGFFQKKFDFGPAFGKHNRTHMYLEEMRSLPEQIPTLRETGYYVGGFNWFVDHVVLPLALVGLKIRPDKTMPPISRMAAWAVNKLSKPPYHTIMKLEASGRKNAKPAQAMLTISHPNGNAIAAIPVVACLLQYLDGSIGKPGLWQQAHVAEPGRMLADMERLGLKVEMSGTVLRNAERYGESQSLALVS